MPFFHDTELDCVFGEFQLSNDYSGAPNFVHGGITLALADEAMAWACIACGHQWAVTTETSTRFLGAVYVGKAYRIEARIVDRNETTMTTQAQVVDPKGRIRVESRATFTTLGEAQAARAVGDRSGSIPGDYLRSGGSD